MTRFPPPPRRLAAVLVAIASLSVLAQPTAAQQLPSEAAVTSVTHERKVTELNISIVEFDPGVPKDRSLHRDLQVFPRIREIEALFLPFVLRETLVATDEWGAVRVVPEPDIGAELLVSGTIVRSDGATLELRLLVIDASGREWINRTYAGVAPVSYEQSDAAPGLSGYEQLYDAIAQDLLLARNGLENKALRDIVEISVLRHANQLAPSAFGEYLDSRPDGTFRLNRLPAENDPMLARVERIRGVEYVITDAVDAQFQELHAEIASTYDLWREYRRQFADYQREEARRQQNARSDAPRGSYEALLSRYNNYKWDRLAAQEQEKWAVGFDNEVGPTILAMETRVAELEGWVQNQYADWRRLLAEIFLLETGLEE